MDRSEALYVVGRVRALKSQLPALGQAPPPKKNHRRKRKTGKPLSQRMKEKIERDIQAATFTLSKLAAKYRVSKSTVSRLAEELLYKPVQGEEKLAFQTRSVGPHICAQGLHRTTFEPCVQCRAQQAQQANRSQVFNS